MLWWPVEIPILVNGLTILRPVAEKDIDEIFRACQDPIISKYTTIRPDYKLEMAIQFVNERAPQFFANQSELIFTIEHDGKFAGVISLHTIDQGNHRAEIGYWLEKSMRGKGIGVTAAELLTDYGLLTIGFMRIEAMVNVDNPASQKLLEKAGYVNEGILRQRVTNHDGKQVDMVVFSATRN